MDTAELCLQLIVGICWSCRSYTRGRGSSLIGFKSRMRYQNKSTTYADISASVERKPSGLGYRRSDVTEPLVFVECGVLLSENSEFR